MAALTEPKASVRAFCTVYYMVRTGYKEYICERYHLFHTKYSNHGQTLAYLPVFRSIIWIIGFLSQLEIIVPKPDFSFI